MKRKRKKKTKNKSEYLAGILERMSAKPQLGSRSQLSAGFPTGLQTAHSSHQEDGSFQPGFGLEEKNQESTSFLQGYTRQQYCEPTAWLLAVEDLADVDSQGAWFPMQNPPSPPPPFYVNAFLISWEYWVFMMNRKNDA